MARVTSPLRLESNALALEARIAGLGPALVAGGFPVESDAHKHFVACLVAVRARREELKAANAADAHAARAQEKVETWNS